MNLPLGSTLIFGKRNQLTVFISIMKGRGLEGASYYYLPYFEGPLPSNKRCHSLHAPHMLKDVVWLSRVGLRVTSLALKARPRPRSWLCDKKQPCDTFQQVACPGWEQVGGVVVLGLLQRCYRCI